jgi:hypothetical protein
VGRVGGGSIRDPKAHTHRFWKSERSEKNSDVILPFNPWGLCVNSQSQGCFLAPQSILVMTDSGYSANTLPSSSAPHAPFGTMWVPASCCLWKCNYLSEKQRDIADFILEPSYLSLSHTHADPCVCVKGVNAGQKSQNPFPITSNHQKRHAAPPSQKGGTAPGNRVHLYRPNTILGFSRN